MEGRTLKNLKTKSYVWDTSCKRSDGSYTVGTVSWTSRNPVPVVVALSFFGILKRLRKKLTYSPHTVLLCHFQAICNSILCNEMKNDWPLRTVTYSVALISGCHLFELANRQNVLICQKPVRVNKYISIKKIRLRWIHKKKPTLALG